MVERITLILETVTPLFLSGANPRTTAEIRPPSFRGLMRYWFRALAGGVMGDQELNMIREKESSIFGSPDDKYGQSSVWVRMGIPKYNQHYTARVLPHHDDIWTSHQGKKLRNKPQPAIPPGVSPTLTLTLKPGSDIKNLETALWSLLVGVALGGIGKRSRRGFGSLRVKNFIGELPSELSNELTQQLEQSTELPASGEELATHIGQLLASARSAFAMLLGNPTPRFNAPPHFSALEPDTPVVVWAPKDPAASYVEILSPLMNMLSDKMHEMGEHKFAQAFGGIRPRRASPLWVSTHRLQNNGWALVLTHLKAQHLPSRVENQHHLVTEFLNSPPDGWAKTEVPQ